MTNKILFIDDHIEDVEPLIWRLEDQGYKVVKSNNPLESIQIFTEHKGFDIVICDFEMPKMDGASLIQNLLMVDRDLPVIMLTAYDDYLTQYKALDAGAFWFISKKVTENQENYLLVFDRLIERAFAFRRYRELIIEMERLESVRDLQILENSMISILGHEIRKPIIGLMGYAEVLLDIHQLSDSEILEQCELIKESGKEFVNVFSELIELIRLQYNSYKISYSSFPPLIEIKEILNAKSELYKIHCNELEIKDNDLDCFIIYDSVLFKSVIGHLVDNAFKYTHNGKIVIEISKHQDNTELQLSIKDTGCGISEDRLEEMMKPFRQRDEIHKRMEQGLGVGLSIAKKILDLCRTEFEIKSVVDYGTEIKMNFPIAPSSKRYVNEPKTLGHRMHVLLVNLHPYIEKKLCLISDLYGDCDSAEDSISAFGKVHSKFYDFIFIGADEEAFHFIKNIKRSARISAKIIGVVRSEQEINFESFAQKGYSDLLYIPFTDDELINFFDTLISRIEHK